MASQAAASARLPLSFASGGDDDDTASAADSSRELPPAGAAARVLGMFSGIAPVVPQIREEFEVPRSEALLFDAACALKERHMLLQGRLYVFQSRAAFFSSVFGVVHKRIMPFDEVTAIRRTSARRVFGAVEIVCGPQQLLLTSFWDRDKAATALLDAWLASGAPAARLFLDSVEKPGAAVGPGAVPQRGDDASSSEGEPEAPPEPQMTQQLVSEEDSASASAAHNLAEATSSEEAGSGGSSPGPTAEHLGSLLDAARATKEPLLSGAPVVLSAEAGGDGPAPIPQLLPTACAIAPPAPPAEGAAPLPVAPGGEAAAELDCSPGEFFALFLADGSRFTEAFRSARGERDVGVQPWRDDAGAGGAACRRVVTFRAPLDAVKGVRLPGIPSSTRIREEQRCAFHDCSRSGEGEPSLIVLESTSAQLDIPYGDSFVLEARLELRSVDAPASAPRCAASVAFRVRWLKAPPRLPGVKHKIETQSRDSTAEAYRMLFAMAQGYLRRWQQVAEGARKRGAEPAPRPPKVAKTSEAAAAASNPRLEAALAKLDAATAEDIRAALGLPQAEAVAEAAPPAAPDDGAPSPRSKAAELAALRQSMVPSSAVAFGAVVDALQLAADALKEQGAVGTPRGEGTVVTMQQRPGLRRAALAAALLGAMLLSALLSFFAGLRRGRATQPVLRAPATLACDAT